MDVLKKQKEYEMWDLVELDFQTLPITRTHLI